jgi:NEDD8-activating enzyme E1
VDKDRREHMTWIHDRAAARAALFNITGLTYEKTLGSVKNIIPAVASTNAVIAAACVLEAFKCLTFSGQICNTYLLYNGQSMAG